MYELSSQLDVWEGLMASGMGIEMYLYLMFICMCMCQGRYIEKIRDCNIKTYENAYRPSKLVILTAYYLYGYNCEKADVLDMSGCHSLKRKPTYGTHILTSDLRLIYWHMHSAFAMHVPQI